MAQTSNRFLDDLARLATDAVGAGAGEHVFYVRAREAALPFEPAQVPTDATITGIVDHWSVG